MAKNLKPGEWVTRWGTMGKVLRKEQSSRYAEVAFMQTVYISPPKAGLSWKDREKGVRIVNNNGVSVRDLRRMYPTEKQIEEYLLAYLEGTI